MAGIPLLSGFNITSDSPADTRLVLTKAEMKAMKDSSMPQTYFCTDSETGEIYVYNKTNSVDETTGKFRKFESGGNKPAPNGFNSSGVSDSTPGWGYLTAANGYENGRTYSFANGGGIATAEKGGQSSMQVDGDLYVHEGLDKVEVVGHNHNGSYISSLNLDSISNMTALKNYINSSPAFCGSCSISDGPGGNMWYNVIWIPHRNGMGSGDNSQYGQLFMYPMTNQSDSVRRKFYQYHKQSNTWLGPYVYQPITIDVSGNTATITYS